MIQSPLYCLARFFIVVLVLWVSNPAEAALLVYEGFDYSPGDSLTNASAAGPGDSFGWAGRWTGANTSMATNVSGSLNYTDAAGHSLATDGGSVVIGNPAGTTTNAQPSRSLACGTLNGNTFSGLSNGTYWASFLMQWIGPLTAGSTTNLYVRKGDLAFRSGAYTNPTSTGIMLITAGSPNAANRIGAPYDTWSTWTGSDAGGGTLNTGFAAVTNPLTSVTFVLMRIELDGTSANDTVYTWFNWTNLAMEPALSTASTTNNSANDDNLNNIRLDANGGNAAGTNTVLAFDEFRLGTTFMDVAPQASVPVPPAISSQPASQTVTIGDPATFTVTANSATPVGYQWYFNTNAPLADETNASLIIPSAQTNDAGGYSVVITNIAGSVTSVVATLTVVPPTPPAITTQPQNYSSIPGTPATFSVGASGTPPLRYQWYFNTNTPLAGQTNVTLSFTIASTNDTGGYAVIVTNHYGSATSAVATLTVIPTGPAFLPAFPGADGAAKYVTGGRGGIVYHVTKLDTNRDDAGVGGLRYGLTDANFPAGVPRTIVFDVGGVFWLGRYGAESNHLHGWDSASRYNLSGNTTIAGQTAPGPVIIAGGVTKFSRTNSIVRNLTFAPSYGTHQFQDDPSVPPTLGKFPDDYTFDAVDISGKKFMLDHLTTIYFTDESISCNERTDNLTIQYCNISQGENYPEEEEENPGTYSSHAYAHLLQAGANAKISILHNLYAHLRSRIPALTSEIVGAGPFNDFRNNVIYNWLSWAGYGGPPNPSNPIGFSYDNFLNNFYLAGPGGDNASGTNIVYAPGQTWAIFTGRTNTYACVSGNLVDSDKDGYPNNLLSADSLYFDIIAQSSAYDVNIGVTLSAPSAFTNVLRYVGSRWWTRPYDFTVGNTNDITTNDITAYIDERLIRETFTGTGKVMAWADDPFNSDPAEGWEWRSLLALRADPTTGAAPFNRPANWDTDGDGMSDTWELEHGLNPNMANNNDDFDNDGYTDLEEYLNEIAAWPAPGDILFTGATNSRYAEIYNWEVSGQTVTITNLGSVTTWSQWQPSKYDTAIISNRTVVVDAVGQHAGSLRLRDNAALNLTGGWLKVSNTLEIASAGNATLNLSGGRLRVGTLTKGAGTGTFNFTGGTLSADVVGFNLLNQGGVIAPGNSAGQTHVLGSLALQAGSTLELELGTTNSGQSDLIVVDGALVLGGTLNVTNLAGFGAGTYTLIAYGGALSGSLAIGSKPWGYDCTLDTNTSGQVRLVVGQQPGGGQPVFGGIGYNSGNVVMSGTGPTNGTYHLLTSTNVALPLSQWTPIATNTFGAGGQFSITNAIDSHQPQTFFQLLLP